MNTHPNLEYIEKRSFFNNLPISTAWTIIRTFILQYVLFIVFLSVVSSIFDSFFYSSITQESILQRIVNNLTSSAQHLWALGLLTSLWICVSIVWKLKPALLKNVWPFEFSEASSSGSQAAVVREMLASRTGLTPEKAALFDRFIVAEEIEERAERLRRRSSIILGSIALSLVVAAIIVIFAGRLTSIDAAAVSNIDKIKAELLEVERRFAVLYDVKRQLFSATIESQPSPNTTDASKLRPRAETFPSSLGVPQDLAAVDQMILILNERQKRMNELLNDAWMKELALERPYNDWRYIVATAITRVGVVLIIVFLVQILMGLYRYNTRLTTFYNSRKDLLRVWNGQTGDLAKLSDILAPPRIDFGRDPKHPLEDIIRAIGDRFGHSSTQSDDSKKTSETNKKSDTE
jgi:hypothetical protein